MKLNCKRIDFTYIPGEEIFNFPEESGLPFLFDVEEELTGDPAAMDAVGKMLDEAEKLAEKAKTAIKAALADEDSRYHTGEPLAPVLERFRKATQREPVYQCIFHEDDGSLTESYGLMFE